MSTKAPSQIIEASQDSLEKKIYSIAMEVPAEELNDNYRLGYCLWGYVKEKRGTLLQAIHSAAVRSKLSKEEIANIVSAKLIEQGIQA